MIRDIASLMLTWVMLGACAMYYASIIALVLYVTGKSLKFEPILWRMWLAALAIVIIFDVLLSSQRELEKLRQPLQPRIEKPRSIEWRTKLPIHEVKMTTVTISSVG